jgi:hypothetical protein
MLASQPLDEREVAGIRKTPRTVATSIPKKTTAPMTFCAPAPAPLAIISG